jgi:hypothetical protein
MRRSTFAPTPALRNRVNRDAAKAQARLASTLPHSPVIPAAGLFAAWFVLWPGSLLALYFANRASEEPPVSFREMARPVICLQPSEGVPAASASYHAPVA